MATKGKDDFMTMVDIRRLAMGLKLTFDGIGLIFDSIGADKQLKFSPGLERLFRGIEIKEVPDDEEDYEDGEEAKDDAETDGSSDVPVPDNNNSADDAQADEVKQPGKTDISAQKTPENDITQDDITKIIVQKIKQDRTNNEKISAILKTYDVSKVSELPASKYESFITDISAI